MKPNRISEMIKVIGEHYGVNGMEFRDHGRAKPWPNVKRAIAFALREYTKSSLQDVGRFLQCDHTSVISLLRTPVPKRLVSKIDVIMYRGEKRGVEEKERVRANPKLAKPNGSRINAKLMLGYRRKWILEGGHLVLRLVPPTQMRATVTVVK